MLTDKEIKTLNLISEDISFENYFFKKVKDPKWFYPLKDKGFFKPKKAPGPKPVDPKDHFIIPEWNVLPFLEKISEQVNIPGNEKYIDELLLIVKDVSIHTDSDEKPIDNYRTWYYFVKILLNLPNDKIPFNIIELIPIWLVSRFDSMLQGAEITTKLLPKFLSDNPEDIKKAEKIIKSITEIKTFLLPEEKAKILDKKEEKKLVIDYYWLEKAFEKYSATIGEKCTNKVIEDLTKKIRSLLQRKEDGTYYSFYEKKEYHISNPLEMLTFILKRVLIAKDKSDVNATKKILKQFLKDEFLYFPKMALYIIGQNTDNYKELFWEILDTDIGDSLMYETLYFGEELKYVLKNLKDLTDKQELLNKKIDNAVKRHDYKEDSERYIAMSKQEIYEALSHDPYFKSRYKEMKKITNVDRSLHAAVGSVETRWGPGPSPLTKEEIIKMPNDKLAEILATFRTKDSWRGPSVGGLADLIAEVANEMPGKFIEDMHSFKDTGYIYIYEILKGIREAWKGKKDIDWDKAFDFIEKYINRKEFWKDKFIVEKDEWLGGATHQWIAGIVAELIQDGTRDDAWAFPEKNFEKADKIIFLLLDFDNLKVEEDKEITDYVTYTLNTSLGKAITALILLTLRIARVNDKNITKNEIKWAPKYKEKYEEVLSNKIIEGFTNFGRYMPNFYYLDNEWVKEKIRNFEDEKGSKYWEAFINGYLSIGRVYDNLFSLMKSHYQYSISYDFSDKRDNEYLVQHISLAYLRGQEPIDTADSLFKQILDEFKYEQIEDIIGFFWMQRGHLTAQNKTNEKIRRKIIEFWKWLYEKYKSKEILSVEDKKIISDTIKLAAILPQINKEYSNWLMLSAPYVHEDFNSSFFVEYLNELKDKGDSNETAKHIGEIFLKMLEKFTPYFDEKHIRSIVEFLCESNNTKIALKICNIYGSRGYEFLRDIYEKSSNK